MSEMKTKEIVLNTIENAMTESQPRIDVDRIRMGESGKHGFGRFVLTFHSGLRLLVEWNYSTQSFAPIKLGVEVNVAEFPEQCLDQFIMNDDQWCGQPHHYRLSEDSAKVQYVRHGTNACGETGNTFVEEEYGECVISSVFSHDELAEMEWMTKRFYGSDSPSMLGMIMRLVRASEQLYY